MESVHNLGYLLHHVSTVVDRQSDILLQERLDIGFSQFKILLALKWQQGTQQKRIAEYLGQTEASISRQIKMLDDAGLVQSRVRPENRREHVTTLTAKGEKRITLAMEILNDFHAPIFARLNTRQQQQLHENLESLHHEVCRSDKPGTCHH